MQNISYTNKYSLSTTIYYHKSYRTYLIPGIYWTTYEKTKRIFDKPDSEKNTFLFNFFCGSVAGSVSTYAYILYRHHIFKSLNIKFNRQYNKKIVILNFDL